MSLRPIRAASTEESTEGKPASGRVTGGDGGKAFNRPDDAKPLRLEKVERLGEEAWAGVAAVDRRSDGTVDPRKRKRLLWAGDAAAILLFAAIGRGSHAELDGFSGVISTAWPFMAGWSVASTWTWTDAYGDSASGSDVKAAAGAAARCWLLATPVSLALRGAAKGAVPPLPFIIVASVATGTILIGWRAALAALTKDEDVKGGDRQGGPMEFLSLLKGLTKRW